MLQECLEVFEYNLKEQKDKIILDSYILSDGTYVLVDEAGNIKEVMDFKYDKTKEVDRSNEYFDKFCYYDYHSQLVSMNKPIDSKKVIHSNNYFSFFVKKENIVSGKLTEDIIHGYYETLKNPLEKKYKNSEEASRIYKLFEEREGEVNQEKLEQKQQWIKEHIFQLEKEKIDMNKKEYLKIFFEAEEEEFEREETRYLLPNIYNSNDYNVEVDNQVYGLPDNNLGMNGKKPFLSIKSRKIPASYLLNGEKVILQKKFFDYLMNFASEGKCNVYVDTESKKIKRYGNRETPREVKSGYYLRIKKGKELEILNQDNLVGYRDDNIKFDFEEIIQIEPRKHSEYKDKYKRYYKRLDVGNLIHEVYFSNCLINNYYTEAGKISVTDEVLKYNMIESREQIFDWVYKGIDHGIEQILERVSFNVIKNALAKGYRERAVWQLNLRWSFQEYFSKGEKNMKENREHVVQSVKEKVFSDTIQFPENDEEYYYVVGQLVGYLLSLNKSRNKNQSLLNPFMNIRKDEVLKKRILQLYKKYNYTILEGFKRVKNEIAMVMGYQPTGEVNEEMILFGYASDNFMYMKEEK